MRVIGSDGGWGRGAGEGSAGGATRGESAFWPTLSASVPCPNPVIADIAADMPKMMLLTLVV